MLFLRWAQHKIQFQSKLTCFLSIKEQKLLKQRNTKEYRREERDKITSCSQQASPTFNGHLQAFAFYEIYYINV
uniref:Uncharacterized protein n=1 Tax=Glossina palpalis gambiensis TaxID=67801 RepID=A0A1B0BQY9_9MUSC